MPNKSSMKSGERSFTIDMAAHVDGCPTKFSRKDFSGRYVSKTPSGAASKALTQLCNVKKVRGQCTLFIKMRETTQGSNKKEFLYNVKREKLANPVELSGRTLEYKNKIKSTDSMPNCRKSHKSSGRMRKQHSRSKQVSTRGSGSSSKSKSGSSSKSRSKSRSTKKNSKSFLGLF